MPTTRRRRSRHLAPRLTQFQAAWFLDAALPEPDRDDTFWRVISRHHAGGPACEAGLWTDHRDELLHEWLVENPGRRPSCWWCFDAPRQPAGTWPGMCFDGKEPLPRERLGGGRTKAPPGPGAALAPRRSGRVGRRG